MSQQSTSGSDHIVADRRDLVSWFVEGEKPKAEWRIGTEHEKFVFNATNFEPVGYGGTTGIRSIMERLANRFDWQPVYEAQHLIGLKKCAHNSVAVPAVISLEPGGQFELSGSPLQTIHDTMAETQSHFLELADVCRDLGVNFLGVGFSPNWSLPAVPHMPKERYTIMKRYMPRIGARGLDMMFRTSTVQTNLDFSDENDMVKKFRVGLALQPIVTAMFASSPFTDGRPNGFKSMRSQIWRETDATRTGILPFVFDGDMGYERYVDYALDVPMYFIYRDGRYIDVSGASFRAFLNGQLPQLPNLRPTLQDWSDHLTTLFPEARLKRYIEMRGADSGSVDHIAALPALWAGLLYDDDALDAASDLIKGWTAQSIQELRNAVPRLALDARFGRTTVRVLAAELLNIASSGLARRAQIDAFGRDETIYLEPLREIVRSGRTIADRLLELYHGRWNGSVVPAYEELGLLAPYQGATGSSGKKPLGTRRKRHTRPLSIRPSQEDVAPTILPACG